MQSGDLCCFEPIKAVTAQDGSTFEKGKSQIQVGDVVFCKVQQSVQFYAHLALDIKTSQQVECRIGNIAGHSNGYCYDKDIFGILEAVYVWSMVENKYLTRPLPKTNFRIVSDIVAKSRWDDTAAELCKSM